MRHSFATQARFALTATDLVRWLAFVTAVALTLFLLPGAPALPTFAAVTLITLAALAVYRHSAGWSSRGETVLIAASALLAVGIIANVYVYTTVLGGTDSQPVLVNPDAERNFNDAIYYLGINGSRSPGSHGLYPLIVTAVFTLTGPSITAALCLSMAATLTTLICVSTIWVRLMARRSDAWLAMAATAAVCYFMASGCILVKDAWTVAAFALAAVALSRMQPVPGFVTAMSVSAFMLFMARPNMLLALILGILIVFPATPHQRHCWHIPAVMIALIAALFCLAHFVYITPRTDIVAGVVNNDVVSFTEPRHQIYASLIGDYHLLPAWRRILLMPFSAAVQFFIPFPWNWLRDIDFGASLVYAHLAYPWYLFGGTAIYYTFFNLRHSPALMRAIFLWGVIIWLIPCWSFGGTISRYGLMAVPLLAPAVSLTLTRSLRRRSFIIFSSLFILLVAITLLVCHHLQSGISQ